MSEDWLSADGIAISFFLFAGANCLAPLLLFVAEPSPSLSHIIVGVGGVGGGLMASHHNAGRIREPIIGFILLLLYAASIAVSSREHLMTQWGIPLVGILGAAGGAWSAQLITKRRSTRLGLAIAGITFVVGVALIGLMRTIPPDGDQLYTATPLGIAICLAIFVLAIAVAYRRGVGVGSWALFFGAALLSTDWLPGLLLGPAIIGTGLAVIRAGCSLLAQARWTEQEQIPTGRVVNS